MSQKIFNLILMFPLKVPKLWAVETKRPAKGIATPICLSSSILSIILWKPKDLPRGLRHPRDNNHIHPLVFVETKRPAKGIATVSSNTLATLCQFLVETKRPAKGIATLNILFLYNL